jgi:Na+/pantothenate symporter
LKGLMVASFFAAFISTFNTHLNWGTSYVINDFYKRFIAPDRGERHYVLASRIATLLMACGITLSAFLTESIRDAFDFVLNFTAGVGVVHLARWFWWRVNAWSEITAMLASIPAYLLHGWVAKNLFHLPIGPYSTIYKLGFMVVATGLVWVPVTLLTPAVTPERLRDFFRRVRPPGPGWRRWGGEIQVAPESLSRYLLPWMLGLVFIYSWVFGLGMVLLGPRGVGWLTLGVGSLSLVWILRWVRREGDV